MSVTFTIRLKITQKDIERGHVQSLSKCAVSLALDRAFRKLGIETWHYFIGAFHADVFIKDQDKVVRFTTVYEPGDPLHAFVRAFDCEQPVSPLMEEITFMWAEQSGEGYFEAASRVVERILQQRQEVAA